VSSVTSPSGAQHPRKGLPLRLWFLVAVVSGALAIVLGEFGAAGSVWITLGGPLLVMAVYIAIGWRLARTAESVSQFADSVYYLGFLLTLTSLVVALGGLEGDKDVSSIITLFGVKLVTTLVGLGVRVYLTNFRPSVEDSVEVAEEMLSRAAENLKHRFDQIAVDLASQTHAINLTLDTARKEIDSTLSAVIRQIRAELSQSVEASSRSLRDSLDHVKHETTRAVAGLREALETTVKDLMDTVGSGARSLGGTLTSASSQISTASTELAARLERVTVPVDIFSVKLSRPLDALAAEIESSTKKLSTLGDAEVRCAEATTALSSAIAATRASVAGLEAQSGQLAGRVKDLSDVFEHAVAAAPSFRDLREEIEGHAANIKAIAGSTGDAYAVLRREIDVTRTRLHGVEEHCERWLAQLAAFERTISASAGERAPASKPGDLGG
jgi:hypothetical protein